MANNSAGHAPVSLREVIVPAERRRSRARNLRAPLWAVAGGAELEGMEIGAADVAWLTAGGKYLAAAISKKITDASLTERARPFPEGRLALGDDRLHLCHQSVHPSLSNRR